LVVLDCFQVKFINLSIGFINCGFIFTKLANFVLSDFQALQTAKVGFGVLAILVKTAFLA